MSSTIFSQGYAAFALVVALSLPGAAAAEDCGAAASKILRSIDAEHKQAASSEADADTVTLSTTEGDVDVQAQDAKPTENWFGKPPRSAVEKLETAVSAAQSGDYANCEKNLREARQLINEQ